MYDHERIRRYAERYFARHDSTAFPTVREVARALRLRQYKVELECDGDPDCRLMLTGYGPEDGKVGDLFVEVLPEENEEAEGQSSS